MATRITVRRDTLANFLSARVIPANGEPIGITDSTGKVITYKIGDGVNPVDQLPALSKGDPGPQGLPGTNAVPADTAVAGYIATEGTSGTRTAITNISGTGGALINGLGTSDDGAVINAAMTSTGLIRTWSLPANSTLNIVTGVTVPAGKTLRMAGTTVLKKTSGAGQVVFLSAGSTLDGGTIDGNNLVQYCASANGSDTTFRGVKFTGSANYGINASSDRTTIDGCQFLGLPSYAALIGGTSAGHRITGNYIAGGRGVQLKDNVSDSVVSGNSLNLTTGVGIEPFGSGVKRIAIVGNTIYGTPQIGISVASANACTISGNVVIGCSQIGIENAEGASFTAITGNTISAGAGSGIQATTSNDSTKPLRNVTITGNTVTDVGEGIGVASGRRISIIGNTIHNTSGSGINLRTNPVNCTIDDNTVSTTDTITAAPSGIQVTGTGHKIHNNTIDQGERSAVAAGSGILCVGGSDHTIIGNRIVNTKFGIELNSCATTVLDNNRTINTGQYGLAIYGTGSASSIVYRHMYRATAGSVTNGDINATVTGPLVTV